MNFVEKVLKAERTLRLAAEMSKKYYGQPLIIAYSMGKDSDTMLHLAEKVLKADEFEVLNSHTSVDFPESIYHRKEVFERLKEKGIKATVYYPKDKNGEHLTMWKLILETKTVPTRTLRKCCSELKEISTPNRMVALGVRAAESSGRQGRDTFGIRGATREKGLFYSLDHTEEVHHEAQEFQDPVWHCTLIKAMEDHNDTVVNPIYEWTDSDVWEYIRQEGIKTNPLYQTGRTRVGCLGCPMANYRQRARDFAEYPTYKQAYINTFQKMLERRIADGMQNNPEWTDGEAIFNWWIEVYKHEVKGQLSLFDNGEGTQDAGRNIKSNNGIK